jgi:ComEC/Rec2-related protein
MRAWLRRSVERHPLLWVAVAATAAVVTVDQGSLAGWLVVVLAAGIPGFVGLRALPPVALLLALAAAVLHAERTRPQEVAQRWIGTVGASSAAVTARVVGLPQATGGGWSALVEIHDGGPAGKVWWWGAGPAAAQGEMIAAKGLFRPFPEPRNPGEFEVGKWLHRQGAWGVFEAQGLARQVVPPPWWSRHGQRARAWFREAVTNGLDPAGREAAVIRAMVLGENPDDDALIESYRASGTLHVFSVSGMHVAMVGAIIWLLLKMLGVPRRPAVFIIIVGMFAYAWITGMKPPATRSVTMAAVLLGGFLFRRRPDLLNALGLALLLALLADGHLIFLAGVQLSFGVVMAIGLGTAWATRLFSKIEQKEEYLPLPLYGWWRTRWLHFRQGVATALGASTAASIGSVPLTLWHFGFFSPVSVLASPLIGLPVFALMALALLSAALSPLPGVGERINRLNGKVANFCTGIATTSAAVPGGSFNFPRDRPGEDFLIVYDTGHGGGAACLHDGGSSVLLDTAHRPGFRRIVLSSLRHMALRPESLVLSHPDGGHLGGAVEALDALPVRQILLPVERARSQSFRALQEAAGSRGVATTRGQAGRTYRISPDAWIEVLHEPDPLDFHAVADQRVMVVRLHWQGWRILFLSDAGWRTERAMLESGRDLGADVIVAGRHRNDSTMGDPFLAAVNPRAIVAGHADFPPEERVPAAWQAACENAGIRVFHQGRTGGVTLVPGEDGTLVVRGFLDGAELVLRK